MTNFQDVIKTADYMKKPAKRDIQKMIQEYSNSLGDDITQDEKEMFAKMYKFFMPAQSKNIKTVFDWVALAKAKNDHRYYLNYVYVTNSRIIATDGHRLHIAQNIYDMEPGFYNHLGDKVENEDFAKYPDVNRVIPDVSDSERENVNSLDELKSEFTTINNTTAKMYQTNNDREVNLNYSYLKDVLSAPEVLNFVSIRHEKDSVYFEFKKHGMRAVIMPMMPVN